MQQFEKMNKFPWQKIWAVTFIQGQAFARIDSSNYWSELWIFDLKKIIHVSTWQHFLPNDEND